MILCTHAVIFSRAAFAFIALVDAERVCWPIMVYSRRAYLHLFFVTINTAGVLSFFILFFDHPIYYLRTPSPLSPSNS